MSSTHHLPLLLLLGMLASYAVLLLVEPDVAAHLGREDGFFENLGALSFLIASAFFLAAGLHLHLDPSRQADSPRRRRHLYFLLAAMFFFAFGEEISWGQRILGFSTPAWLGGVNRQGEFNFHNMMWFHRWKGGVHVDGKTFHVPDLGELFGIFWFAFCLLLPIGARVSAKVRGGMAHLGIPRVPLVFGGLLVVNALLAHLVGQISGLPSARPIIETKECWEAVVFAALAGVLLLAEGRKEPGHPSQGRT